jgi:hypothetical protein
MCRDFAMTEDPIHPLILQAQTLAAELPSQLGDNSWAFDPYLILINPDAQDLVDHLLDDVCYEWVETFSGRKPSTDTQEKFWDFGRAILANLLRAECNKWPTTVGIYRSKGALEREKRYRPRYRDIAESW